MKELMQVAEINISYYPINASHPQIITSMDAFSALIDFYPLEWIGLQEQFLVMYLNRSSKVLGIYRLSKGGLTGTVADVRLILATALKTAASSIILSHNHPSGALNPSNADIQITQKISDAAKIMEIKLMDHIIVVPERKYFSFADDGLI